MQPFTNLLNTRMINLIKVRWKALWFGAGKSESWLRAPSRVPGLRAGATKSHLKLPVSIAPINQGTAKLWPQGHYVAHYSRYCGRQIIVSPSCFQCSQYRAKDCGSSETLIWLKLCIGLFSMSLNYVFYRSHDRLFPPARWLNKTIHLSVAAWAPSLTLYNQLWLSSGRLTDGTSYLVLVPLAPRQESGCCSGKDWCQRPMLLCCLYLLYTITLIMHPIIMNSAPSVCRSPAAQPVWLGCNYLRNALGFFWFLFFLGGGGFKKLLTVNQNLEQAFERQAREANLSLSEPFPLCLPRCVFVPFVLHLVLIVLSFSPSFLSYLHSSIQGTFSQKSTESREKNDVGLPCKSIFYVLTLSLLFHSFSVFACFLWFSSMRILILLSSFGSAPPLFSLFSLSVLFIRQLWPRVSDLNQLV